MLFLMILSLFPALIYVLIHWKKSLDHAIYSALIAKIIFCISWFYLMGSFDLTLLLDMTLLLLLAIMSLKFHDSKWFKYQPAVVFFLGGILILGYQYFSNPILVRLMTPFLELPEFKEQMTVEMLTPLFSTLSHFLGYVFMIYAAVMWRLASIKNEVYWLIGRICILPMCLILTMVVAIYYADSLV